MECTENHLQKYYQSAVIMCGDDMELDMLYVCPIKV